MGLFPGKETIMSVSRAETWVTDTEIQVSAVPVRLKAVEIQGNPSQGADCYIHLYNAANPDTNAVSGDIVIPVFQPNVDDGKIRQKVPLGGLRFPTAFAWLVTTERAAGGTAPAAANAPLSVQIFYDPA